MKIYKNNSLFFSKRGAHAQRAGPGSALDSHRILLAKYLPYYKDQILFGQFSSLCNVDCITYKTNLILTPFTFLKMDSKTKLQSMYIRQRLRELICLLSLIVIL